MSNIKLVAFDLEGTLFDWSNSLKMISKKTKLNESTIHEFIISKLPLLEKGELDPINFWNEFISIYNLNISAEELNKIWIKFHIYKKLSWEFAKELQKLGFKIAICSNSWPGTINSLKTLFPDLGIFDYSFDSSVIGFKKPDDDFFKFVEEKTGYKGRQILLIDDSEDNLAGADYHGWRTMNIHDVSEDMQPSFIKNL